ncbi:MAG: hypothetical protein VX699_06680, partial [Myxococcota bacterium]|nr:hypothetical protein [Myxococcota bacterium]
KSPDRPSGKFRPGADLRWTAQVVCGRGAAGLCSTSVVHGAIFLWILLVKFWNEAGSVGCFGFNREVGVGAFFFRSRA